LGIVIAQVESAAMIRGEGKRPPSIEDVARVCGVSKGTVSKALSQHAQDVRISQATQEKIRTTAAAMGYHPDRRVRLRARRRSNFIGLIYGGYAPLIAGVYEQVQEQSALRAMELGYQLALVPGRGERRTWSRTLSNHRFDGFVIMEGPPGMEQFFLDEDIPAVVLNETGEGRLPRVLCDEVLGTTLAVEHLLQLGHRRISFCHFGGEATFAKSITHYSFAQRLETFRALVPAWSSETHVHIEGSVEATITRLQRKRSVRETAIICECDTDAFRLMQQCRKSGIRIPEDISVLCFNYLQAMAWSPFLWTAIDIPMVDMARAAVSRVIDQVESAGDVNAEVQFCPPRLVLGESVIRENNAKGD
jgi:DNA-binding LacI/PurR family transcriptional regulator